MIILPQNNYILCKQINQTKHEDSTSKIIYEKEELPIYEIIDIGKNLNDFKFNIGDNVICCSTGTKLKIEKDIYFLFDEKNIVGKIL
jgi:co-chaperonin GroES (HSP10)